jgi:hypothetical protein
MALDSGSRHALPEVLVGHSRVSARWFSLAAVLALVVFGLLFSLLAWNVLDGSSAFVLGTWVLLGGWTVVLPVVYAYRNDGLLVSWLLASVGPFAVGAVLALSPALTGAQAALMDVLGFALELALEFGLPVGAVGFAVGSWARITRNLSKDRSDADRTSDRCAILAGTTFLLSIPAIKLAMNSLSDILASPIDPALVGIAVVGSGVGLVLLRLLGEES